MQKAITHGFIYWQDLLFKMKATFAAGCFWSVEEAFRTLKGVSSTVVGFMGGTVKNPTYEQVCSNTTGHAEVVQVEYDPKIVSYDELLELFWKNHDPTSLNRQGLDIGTQYRSALFFHSEKQQELAKISKEIWQHRLKKKIVTEILPASEFYTAEEYHQKYLQKKGISHC